MKKLIFFLIFISGLTGIAQNQELFKEANDAYAGGKYEVAIDLYNQILEQGETSAALHYNLGNAHYKLNHIAPSIFHYEKALQLDPTDEDVHNNLEFARNMAIDAIEEEPSNGFLKLFNTTTAAFSPAGWGWVAIFCIFLFVLFFLIYYFSYRSLLKRIFFIVSMFFFVMAVTSGVIGYTKLEVLKEGSFAIVFAEEVGVRNEPTPRGDEVFTLHEGAKVKVTEEFQEWIEIELPNGGQGWIPQSEVKRL